MRSVTSSSLRSDYRARTKRWYKSARWQLIRARQLRQEPDCQCPQHKGQHVQAEVVDHITPHRGDPRLFWDPDNLQSLTKHCHDSWKQIIDGRELRQQQFEERRRLRGCDESGNPNDPKHHWNQ